jgi:probable HAF family extracellular repeat protein/predicted outer membrane repeat protein
MAKQQRPKPRRQSGGLEKTRKVIAQAVSPLEQLETRVLLSSIAGMVWQDRNGDGVKDAGEPTLAGRTVYVDANDNGLLDAGEASRTSDSNGAFVFSNMAAGDYILRQVGVSGFRPTSDALDGARRVTLVAGQSLACNFGTVREFIGPAQTLDLSDPAIGTGAGLGIATAGGVLAVSSSAGVHMFERQPDGAWNLTATITPPDDPANAQQAGNSLAMEGDTIVVGAPYYDDAGAGIVDGGRVYVYHHDGPGVYSLQATFSPRDKANYSYFGNAISLHNGVLAINDHQNLGNYNGQVEVWRQQTDQSWSRVAVLVGSDSDVNSNFGSDVAVGDHFIVVGAQHQHWGHPDMGGAQIFVETGNTYVPSSELLPPDASGYSYVGGDIAVRGGLIVLAASGPAGAAGNLSVFQFSAATGVFSYIGELGGSGSSRIGRSYNGNMVNFAGNMLLAGAESPGEYGWQSDNGSWFGSENDFFDSAVVGQHSATGDYRTIVTSSPDETVGGIADKGSVHIYERELAGYIRGTTWQDRNSDGVRQSYEPALAGRTVYIDANDDGELDNGETSSITDAGGIYDFANLAPGTYTVRQVIPADWTRTTAAGGGGDFALHVTVAAGQTSAGNDLGSSQQFFFGYTNVTAADGVSGQFLSEYGAHIEGDTAILNAPSTDGSSGALYVFHRDAAGTWSQSQKIVPADRANTDLFAVSSSLSGNTLLVGAELTDVHGTDSGTAYLYTRADANAPFVLSTEFTAPDGTAFDYFGFPVATDGNTAFITAVGRDDLGVDSGAVYVFTRDSAGDWVETQKLHASDAAAGANFGFGGPAFDGRTLVVGASEANGRGQVYVFNADANGVWQQTAELTAPNPQSGDNFGYSVAVDGNNIAVGSDYASHAGGTHSGAAYVYHRNAAGVWDGGTELIPDLWAIGYRLGVSIAIRGDMIVAGADRLEHDNDFGTYFVYRDTGAGWTCFYDSGSPHASSKDRYGNAVSISADALLIGQMAGDELGTDSGAADVVAHSAASWITGTVFTDANLNGVDDSGESPLAGRTVWLDTNNNSVLDGGETSTTTDSTGGYFFNELKPGTYTVRIAQQDEWSQTLPSSAGAYTMTLAPGETQTGRDFGLVNRATVVSGVVWNDRNADGVKDAVEPVLVGRTVYWDVNDNGVLDAGEASVVSAADGSWSIRNVLPGNRVFRQVVPGGWKPVSPIADFAAHITADAGTTTGGALLGSAVDKFVFRQKLFASDPVATGYFGTAVAIGDDGTEFIGDAFNDAKGVDSGAVYLFKKNTQGVWTETGRLEAPDGAAGDLFGLNISVAGDTLVITARNDDDLGSDSGSVYVYSRVAGGNWVLATKLIAPEGGIEQWFGDSIDLTSDGERLVVGAPFATGQVAGSGAAYVFDRNPNDGTWNFSAKVFDPTGDEPDYFGAVSIDGDVLAVGNVGDDGSVADVGSVSIFSLNADGVWKLIQKLFATDQQSGAIGNYVDLHGDTLFVGAAYKSAPQSQQGAVYIFKLDNQGHWQQQQRLTAPDGAANDQFGGRLVLADGIAFVSTYQFNHIDKLYVYRDDGGFWNQSEILSPPASTPNIDFGFRAAWDGRFLLLGADTDNEKAASAGAAFVYERLSLVSYLQGEAFNDLNRNGVRDTGEAAMSGWTVYIDSNDNGRLDGGEESVVTNSHGDYEFRDVESGKYVVRIVQQNEWSQTLPGLGDGWRVDLAPGQTFIGNFGLVNQATVVSGIVWNDRNADGVKDAVEPVLAGRTVYWDVNDNGVLDAGEASAVSGTDGSWSIRNVLPGNRVFRQIIPSGWMAVAPLADAAAHLSLVAGVINNGANLGSAVDRGIILRQKLLASDGKAGDALGTGLAIAYDGTAFLGAGYTDDDGTDSGSVYVFRRNAQGEWTQVDEIHAPDAAAGDRFGDWQLAVAGDTLVIGANQDDDLGANSGSVYVYRRGAGGDWTFETKLTASGGAAGDHFGLYFDLDAAGKTLAVGAPSATGAVAGSGAAYIFERNAISGTWTQTAQLTDPAGQSGDDFGVVSLDGDTLMVGAQFDDAETTVDAGSVSVFTRGANGVWQYVSKLLDGVQTQGYFGNYVDLHGDSALISEWFADVPQNNSGAVFVFRRDGAGNWNEAQRLGATDSVTDDRFGARVALVDGLALVSIYPATGNASKAYVYRDSGGSWVAAGQLTASDGTINKEYGIRIATAGRYILVAADSDSERGGGAGAAYVYERQLAGYLEGTAFNDANKNGEKDAGETPLAGWTVYVDANDNGVKDAGELSMVTDASGHYAFNDLVPGSFIVRIVQQNEWSQTLPVLGDGQRLNLQPGQTLSSDFGIVNQATVVSGTTWNDRNADGVMDAVEPVMGGRTVYWDVNDNGLLDAGEPSTISAADGSYTIRNVLPGVRAIRQVVPGGWHAVNVLGADEGGRVMINPGVANTVGVGSFREALIEDAKYYLPKGNIFIKGTIAAVGQPAVGNGIVRVLEFSGTQWVEKAVLTAPDGAIAEDFGASTILIQDDSILVAAQLNSNERGIRAGAVYVYRRTGPSGWTFTSKLTASDGMPNGQFGRKLEIRGSTLMVTAVVSTTTNGGAVYDFETTDGGSTWTQQQVLQSSSPHAGGSFGYSISLDGPTLIVGAYGEGTAGIVHVFSRQVNGQWSEVQAIPAPDAETNNEWFGLNVSVSGNELAVVNGPFASDKLYYYTRQPGASTWGLRSKEAIDGYTSLKWSNSRLLAGYEGESPTGVITLYANVSDVLTILNRLAASDSVASDYFGTAVFFEDDQAWVTAPGDNDQGPDAEALYAFHVGPAAYLTGSAFEDEDADGVRDAGEPALGGWTVYVDANDNGILDSGEASTTTDSQGGYHFDALVPGSIVVRIVARDEWSQTTPDYVAGYRLVLDSGETRQGVDIGQVHQATVVSGVVWNDRNADGIRDAIEPVIAGRTVYWDQNDNGINDTGEPSAISGADGTYALRNVLPGPRVIRQIVPIQWKAVPRVGTDVAARVVALPGVTVAADLGSYSEVLIQDQKFYRDTPQPGVDLGALSMDGTIAAVGMPGDGNGTVNVFEYSGGQWVQRAVLIEPNSTTPDDFGRTVVVKGDLIFVTASFNNNEKGAGAGAVYVYRRTSPSTWTLASRLVASDGGTSERFGVNLVFDRSTLVVSKRNSGSTGAIYIFETTDGGSTWQQKQELYSSMSRAGGNFGFQMSLEDDTLVVGATGEGVVGYGEGMVHVLKCQPNGQWAETQLIQASDNQPGSGSYQYFGSNVSISGDQMVISRDAPDVQNKLYYYSRQPGSDTWNYISAEAIDSAAFFDWSEGRLVAGFVPHGATEPMISLYGIDASGALMLLNRRTGVGTLPDDLFAIGPGGASSLAFSGDRILVTAAHDDDKGINAGAIYAFALYPSASITGAVYQDANNNGVFDVAESGFPDCPVWLDLNNNGIEDPGEPAQLTNSRGVYDFAGLMPGTYTVRIVAPSLWQQSSPTSDQPQVVTVGTGETATPAFGLYATATVTGKLFSDADGNGTMDGADVPLSGWLVFADLNGNRKVDEGETTAVTDASGDYTLSYLPVRDISVDVLDGAAWGFTPHSVSLQQLLVQTGIDFGSVPAAGQSFVASGTLGGKAAVDTDGNGLVDPFETEGVSNLNFAVWRDDGDGVFEPHLGDTFITNVSSSATGTFATSSLPFGSYWFALDLASPGMLGYSLYGRPSVKRAVVGAQQTPGLADFSILKAYTVTTLADEIPGSSTPAHTSLREALDLVRTDGKDTGVIVFDPALFGGTINLDPVEGQLLVRDNVSILGPATGAITIASAGTSRIFSISNGLIVDLRGLTLSGGVASTGGAVSLGFGATLNGDRLSITDNTATQRGGAIYAASGAEVNLSNTTLSNNSAALQGGAIYTAILSVITLDRDTLSGNITTSSTSEGGGIYSQGNLIAWQLTVANNSSQHDGGGIAVTDGISSLLNSTIASNQSQSGGGVFIGGAADMTLSNTLVAGNLHGNVPDDLAGVALNTASAYNLIGAGGSGLLNGENGNHVGNSSAPIDAKLLPLAWRGGWVATIALQVDSPALDAGSNSLATAAGLTTDAADDPRISDFDTDGSATVDIGAYEASPLIVVDDLVDESIDTDGKISLREAVTLAESRLGFDQIRFSPALFSNGAARVQLNAGELVLSSNLDLSGPAGASLSIDAAGASRVMRIAAGASVSLSNLTLTGGGNVQDGAGLLVAGNVTATGVLLSGNAAAQNGGAIFVASGAALTLLNATLSDNFAANSGGGLYAQAGSTVLAVNDTLTLNRSDSDGNNSGTGGGIVVEAAAGSSVASVRLDNTAVAGNLKGPGTAPNDVAGIFNPASSFNLIGVIDGSTNLNGLGARYGSAAAPLIAGVFPLADNGGPTLTHAIQPGSPLTDGGDNTQTASAGLALDARGLPRVKDGDDDKADRVDIGAFEQQFPLNQAPVLTTIATVPGAVEGVPFDISTDQLLRLSDAHDPENAALGFRVESIAAGSLINLTTGQDVVPGVTLLLPGQMLRWTPPAINFGGDTTQTLAAFTLRTWDGQVLSAGAAVTVNIQVTTVAEPVNYAVLFSGGDRTDLNYSIYYDNLKKTYQALVNQYGVKPYNIYVIYADGRDSGSDMKGDFDSDMSFATNVLPATRDNLRNTLINLSRTLDANDHFFYWTFDHGLGGTSQPSLTGEEIIKGWGDGQAISDEEQRVWLQGLKPGDNAAAFGVPAGYSGVRAGFDTYMFAQCFSGGMLDNLATGVDALGPGTQVYGVAASNHYEASYSDYFAAAFTQALQQGYNTNTQTFDYALAHDGRAARTTYAANGGAWSFNVEHPWAAGASFSIFATPSTLNAAPELRSIAPLKIAASATTLDITYDMLMAAADTASPSGQAIVFSLAGIDIGQVLRDGQPVNLNDASQRNLAAGEKFTWIKPAGASGTLAALRFKILDTDQLPSGAAVIAPIRIGAPVGGPVANDDSVTIQQNAAGVLLTPAANDSGVNLRIKDVGVATYGVVSFDPATGQVRYTPAPEILGADSFSYLISDGINTDIARVLINIVSFDPLASVGTQVRFNSTMLDAPKGWAGLDDSLDWDTRVSAPDWQDTTGVDISEDGVVVVGTSRVDLTDVTAYIGSTSASYRWQSGDTEPYWNFEQQSTRTVTATNTFSFLLATGFYHNGKAIFDGLEATSATNPSALATVRYLAPENGNEGFEQVGGILFDAGTDQQLWLEVPSQDLFPVDVTTDSSNGSATYLAAFNDTASLSSGVKHAELWSVSPDDMHLLTVLAGWGGQGKSIASKINPAGHVIGQAEYSTGNYHAFFYDGISMLDLGALPGQTQSEALAVSKNDIVVGYSSNTGGDPHASLGFIWDAAGGMRHLGTLPPQDGSPAWSVPHDVNSNGVVVGASSGRAFILLGGVMYDLNALVNGLPTGATLTDAEGINDAGQIVATATFPDNTTRAVYLDLVRLFSAAPDNINATSRAPISFNMLSNDTGQLTVNSVDTTGLMGNLLWDAQGNATYDPVGKFDTLGVGQTATTSFSYIVSDGQGGSASAIVTLHITGVAVLSTFHVESFTLNASGFELKLSGAPDLGRINLYDGQDASTDLADLTLVGHTGGQLHGSLFWDTTASTLSFVATGGVLPADDYTLTLFSRSDGIVSANSASLLDGNADNTPGGDYLKNFTVAPSSARTLSIKDFARGPSQGVSLSGTNGLPVSIDDAAGVRAVDFNFRYDPAMLNITSAALASAMPADWSVTVNLATPGLARLSLFGSTALPAGARDLVILQASVPSTATYRTGERLVLESVQLNEGAIAVRGDQAVHKIAYLGDATGNRTLSALDAALIARVGVQLDSGFDAYPMTDPVIITDASGNGSITSLDASYVLAKSINLPQPEIPDLPANLPAPANGPDPIVSLPASVSVAPGGFIDVPISINPANGVEAFNLQFTFDAARFDVQSVDLSAGTVLTSAASSWTLAAAPTAGVLTIGGYAITPLVSGSGAFLIVRLHAKSDAPGGSSAITIGGELNEGGLTLTPVNGSVNVTPAGPAAVVGRRLFYNHSSLDGNNIAANTDDDNAIAADKLALQSGASSHANISGYANGINGVMIDVAALANGAAISSADFDLRVGRAGDPAAWALAPASLSITVRPGAGQNGADRITLVWNDGAIVSNWLRVVVKANSRTGLAQDDVFYFGSLPGDSNGDSSVGFADLVAVAQNYGKTTSSGLPVGDSNLDGNVSFSDLVAVAQNYGKLLPALALSAPAPAAGALQISKPIPGIAPVVKPAPATTLVTQPTPIHIAKPAVVAPLPVGMPLPSVTSTFATRILKPASLAQPLPPALPKKKITGNTSARSLFATTPIRVIN